MMGQQVVEKKRRVVADPEKEKTLVLSGKKVKVTNLKKVYWPEEGYTKGDLIAYYMKISRYILPYLKDRPQSLNRHPNGINGMNFYHKDMEPGEMPSWARTEKLDSKVRPEGIDYLICNDTATLIYMANLGCIEINPWHSTYRKPDYPSYLMLDLDPGEISFTDVVNTALVIKELCDQISVPAYCKTSGATGLHIYIPLAAKYDYEQAKTFAELLAGIAHERLPSTTSIERMTSKRRDRVYIDFLQNRRGQTIAAPYSVRPKPYATVSTPLRWEEVNHQLTPQMFTIHNIEERLSKTGDLWSPVLGPGISLKSALKMLEKLG
jgi:bifunctional non-homologous end joining protein LigD